MLEEEDYNKQIFLEKLDNLMKNDKIFKENMKKAAQNNACDRIITIIKKIEK